MKTKERIKRWLQANPLTELRRKKLRRRLENRNFTLLTPNCLGGILLHDLGLQFLTPTVNLMMTQTDFVQFVFHLTEYLSGNFRFLEDPDHVCPYALLEASGLPPVAVHFTHYKTPEEAESKWRERAARINYDNLFVFVEERDGITKKDLLRLAELPVRGVVAFTCNEYPDIPYAVYLPGYHDQGEVGNILRQNHVTGSRAYERYFDFVEWFNKAEGGNFSVREFLK